MNFRGLVKLYEKKKKMYGVDTFKHVSQILNEAKKVHRTDWLKSPTPNKDHEQSWKTFKVRTHL